MNVLPANIPPGVLEARQQLQALVGDVFSRLQPVGELRGHPVWLAKDVLKSLGYASSTIKQIVNGKHWPGYVGEFYWVLEGEELARFRLAVRVRACRRLPLLFMDGVLDLIMCQRGDTGRRFRRLLSASRPLLCEGALEELQSMLTEPAPPQNVMELKRVRNRDGH